MILARVLFKSRDYRDYSLYDLEDEIDLKAAPYEKTIISQLSKHVIPSLQSGSAQQRIKPSGEPSVLAQSSETTQQQVAPSGVRLAPEQPDSVTALNWSETNQGPIVLSETLFGATPEGEDQRTEEA
ncbi:hypothetical protein EYB53_023130 [Candidatus Chloroploca sp. M-50]|uniref:Uncharacterized protein n=1 Tax=Candidatus Chloroploca mongolica TaxID=2528176 RepID=A0ABS4DGQ7_9CHLR|nr:hypothetical protein [Candidatus Chloroploca mongolica]MBP1468626.1 hypothetical protein [Candidatus Chloroploca mongolica]